MRFQTAIFADGAPCPKALRDQLRRGRFTIVLDGAAENVRREGWLPNVIAGDFDSVRPATLKYFSRQGVTLLHTPDQDYTDLEKAIAWCALRNASSIWVAQALGGRTDHHLLNLALLKRFHQPGRELRIFQPGESIRFAANEKIKLLGPARRLIAVLPFPACKVRSRGLLFEMRQLPLELGVWESVANCARTREVRLEITGEALVVEGTKGR